MCIFWKIRQRKLNINDFGDPLGGGPPYPSNPDDSMAGGHDRHATFVGVSDPIAVRVVLADALEGDPNSPPLNDPGHEADEEAPLLHRREGNPDTKPVGERGWSAWFGR